MRQPSALAGKRRSKFRLGLLIISPEVLAAIPYHEIFDALSRHNRGDWGTLIQMDWKANDKALKCRDERLFSAYYSKKKIKFWIITEWNRSKTTVLFPDEYDV